MPSTQSLTPALDLARKVRQPFPNESAAYQDARTALLAEEIELRRHIERVAEQRRSLPPGGEVTGNYRFVDEEDRQVALDNLFGDKDTLVTYAWMYGPERSRPCPMCTAFLGSMDIPSHDITQKVAFAIIGRSPIQRQLAFKRERGWRNLRFYAAEDASFVTDYRGLAPDGSEYPSLNVFTRKGGKIRHFWAAEMSGDTADPGQDPRGAPDPTPLWNILDLTPEGRGTNWYPKLEY